MHLCIFEDIYCNNFKPLVYYRPVYDLICGFNRLRDKIIQSYPDVKYSLHCRKYLQVFLEYQNPGIDINKIEDNEYLFINGRILANENLSQIIPVKGDDKVYKMGDKIIAARISGNNLDKIKNKLDDLIELSVFGDLPVEEVEIKTFNFIWEIIYSNKNELIRNFESRAGKLKNRMSGKIFDGVNLIEKENIFIGENSVVKPGVVMDASNGPIYIDENAEVFPNSVIDGPVYIGKNSRIKTFTAIYEDVTISETCKVGGEVEASIISPFTNKQHPGFLGHSYLGSWINIGADTNCSDLKNNYSNIRMDINGQTIDTGFQFLGMIMGDHSKTGINTMINTGTTIGFSSSVFGAGFPGKYLPSFSWGDGLTVYNVDKSIETAKRVFARRKKEFSNEEEQLFRVLFRMTENERKREDIKS